MTQATDTQTASALSVGQVAGRIGAAMRALGDGWIEGEVTQVKVHRPSGHVYLTLADESASLNACIWRGRVARCSPLPAQGELVQAHYERVGFYGPRGSTSLVLDRVRPTGDGELLRRRAETLERLREDGLCDPDRRKPLPAFPRRVGVIAARNDANIDVIQALRKRFPPQHVAFCAASVQGIHAVGSLIDALGRLQSVEDVDVIIVARGGGSVADLLAFDDERLCRAIFACAVPVITSIGHTKDRPNCDQVASAFAPVPAKAAELAISHSAAELLEELDRHRLSLRRGGERAGALRDRIGELWARVRPLRMLRDIAEDIRRHGQLVSSGGERGLLRLDAEMARTTRALDATRAMPTQSIELLATRLDSVGARVEGKQKDLLAAIDRRVLAAEADVRTYVKRREEELIRGDERLRPVADRVVARERQRVDGLMAVLRAKDFRRNGWTVATNLEGKPIKSVTQLAVGQELTLHLADGKARVITEKSEKETTDG
ncbi:MAG TPA: exodeoxyribonuclease VII large subunit [Solirubrobacteraceae bacterium]|nr:exodeoxyribonuclease VII large subunit [Solirubrobacteraceae bacterium]